MFLFFFLVFFSYFYIVPPLCGKLYCASPGVPCALQLILPTWSVQLGKIRKGTKSDKRVGVFNVKKQKLKKEHSQNWWNNSFKEINTELFMNCHSFQQRAPRVELMCDRVQDICRKHYKKHTGKRSFRQEMRVDFLGMRTALKGKATSSCRRSCTSP